jgi:hypothetical protein
MLTFEACLPLTFAANFSAPAQQQPGRRRRRGAARR